MHSAAAHAELTVSTPTCGLSSISTHHILFPNLSNWMENKRDRNKHEPLPTHSPPVKHTSARHAHTHTHRCTRGAAEHTQNKKSLHPLLPNTVNPIRAAPSIFCRTDNSSRATISSSPLSTALYNCNNKQEKCLIQNTFNPP